MFNLGTLELELIIGGVVLVLGLLAFRGRGGISIVGPTLVLRRFNIDEGASAKVLVDIAGRAEGITAWLLTIVGIDAETSLKVTGKEVSFKSSSLFGQTHQVVPLPSVSSTHCGYSKPIGYLVIGVIFLIGGILTGLNQYNGGLIIIIGVILGATFLLAYYLSKKIVISLETSGGIVMGLSFKRSVIENVSIDMEQALKVIGIVNHEMIKSQVKAS